MAVPGHFAYGVIMGYYAGKAKLAPNERQARLYLVRALAFPILLHGAYEFFLIQGRFPGLIFVTLGVLALALKMVCFSGGGSGSAGRYSNLGSAASAGAAAKSRASKNRRRILYLL